ncbi:MAG TPA: hypothetical protein VIK04_03285 [Solirubrobacteraceae bacterium]
MAQPFVIAYRDFGQGGARPYLVMQLHGVNGKSGPVWGLVDSGADRTSLPFEFAALMGYVAADLQQQQCIQVAGTTTTHVAQRPCTASVPEIPAVVIDLHPMFVPGSRTILWGRQDVMRRFDVTIMESQQRFSITPVS